MVIRARIIGRLKIDVSVNYIAKEEDIFRWNGRICDYVQVIKDEREGLGHRVFFVFHG